MRYLLLTALVGLSPLGPSACSSDPDPPAKCREIPDSSERWETTIGNLRIRIDGGAAYQWQDGGWSLIEQLHDPGYLRGAYTVDDACNVFRVHPDTGARYPVLRQLTSDFEGFSRFADLFGPDKPWTSFTLLSPAAPEVPDYVALQNCIIAGTCDFFDSRFDLVSDPVHGGNQSLRALSVPKLESMITGKASLENGLVYFMRGDDVHISGWVYLEQGHPSSFFDLEASWIPEGPGPRLMFGDNDHLYVELKWGDKPQYRQPPANSVAMPRQAWVHLEVRYVLSELEDGVVQVWQDGQLIIDARGRTLPVPYAVLDRFEAGISAANSISEDAVVVFDDLSITLATP